MKINENRSFSFSFVPFHSDSVGTIYEVEISTQRIQRERERFVHSQSSRWTAWDAVRGEDSFISRIFPSDRTFAIVEMGRERDELLPIDETLLVLYSSTTIRNKGDKKKVNEDTGYYLHIHIRVYVYIHIYT